MDELKKFDPQGKTRRQKQVVIRPVIDEVFSIHLSVCADDVDAFRDWFIDAGLPDWIDRRDVLLALNWLCYREGAQFRKSHQWDYSDDVEFAKLIIEHRYLSLTLV